MKLTGEQMELVLDALETYGRNSIMDAQTRPEAERRIRAAVKACDLARVLRADAHQRT